MFTNAKMPAGDGEIKRQLFPGERNGPPYLASVTKMIDAKMNKCRIIGVTIFN